MAPNFHIHRVSHYFSLAAKFVGELGGGSSSMQLVCDRMFDRKMLVASMIKNAPAGAL